MGPRSRSHGDTRSLMEAAPAVGGAAGASFTEAEFDENDGEDLVPVLSSVLNALVQRDDKVCA